MLFKFLSIFLTTSMLVIATDFVLSLSALSMIMTAAGLVTLWCCVIAVGAVLWELS